MEAIDELIASLRAQRVAALANGDSDKAADMHAAINVAYEQRAAMVYLRPSSDYLLSVHSASALQNKSEAIYRNMLDDWLRYLNPKELQSDLDAARRIELEKLYWQNINRVTLDGGGFTNFVIAKDDVGNWYVKAYSSDPEAIYKSAINLALFNAGAKLNTNLLQRQKLQEPLETSTDPAERERIETRLDNMTEQESRPLMTLRARYAKQYETATIDGGKVLYSQLVGTGTAASKAVDAAFVGAGNDVGSSCTADTLKPALSGLEDTHLKEPRERLKKLIDEPNSAAGGKLAEAYEGAILSGLVSMNAYSRGAGRALNDAAAHAASTSNESPRPRRRSPFGCRC